MLEGISVSQTDYINTAEQAIVVHMALPDPTIESLLVFLDGEWVLVINDAGANGKAVAQ